MYYLTALMGVFALVAPFVFNYRLDAAAFWVSIVFGAVLIVSSLLEALSGDRDSWEYWVVGGAGVVAIVSPFVLGFAMAAVWTLALVGIVAVIAAVLEITTKNRPFLR